MTATSSPLIASPGGGGLIERRYSTIAIVLHWTIAALILTQIGLGWTMNEWLPDHSPAQTRIETLHISLGLTTLLLIAVRIVVRLARRPPPLPAGLATWERRLAQASVLIFYLLMFALPLTGWAMVSLGRRPIPFWGVTFPKLPAFRGFSAAQGHALREPLQWVHTDLLIWLALANLALHVAGAIKHQFDGHAVLWRMAPAWRR